MVLTKQLIHVVLITMSVHLAATIVIKMQLTGVYNMIDLLRSCILFGKNDKISRFRCN